MKSWPCLLLFLFVALSGFAQHKTIRVAIATSLMAPAKEIAQSFEKETTIKLELIPGASGTLTSQILNGAPFDLLISADKKFTDLLNKKSKLSRQPIRLANGDLTLWSRIELNDFPDDLITNTAIRSIAIAQPDLAPYGAAAKVFLEESGLWKNVKSKMVFANNVSLVNQYISSGATDVVITSLSSQHQLENQVNGYWYALEGYQTMLSQTIGIIQSGDSKAQVDQFVEFLQSTEVQSILTKYGYTLP